jgi:hypothetical protein
MQGAEEDGASEGMDGTHGPHQGWAQLRFALFALIFGCVWRFAFFSKIICAQP